MLPRAVTCALVLAALAGCLNAPPPAAPTAPPPSGPTAPSPPPTAPPSDDVVVTLTASPTTIHGGSPVALVLSATNHRNATVWTNVGIVCTGSWDLRLFDASGSEVRIDDRDSMGCASGGFLTGTLAPGVTATFNDTWDGNAHPRLGESAPLAPGDYTFRGSVRYGDHANASNMDGAPGVVSRNASVVVRVDG